MEKKERCCVEVRIQGFSFPRYKQCDRLGKIIRSGKWYCKQHDPIAVKERAKKRSKKHDAEWDYKIRQQLCVNACKGISNKSLKNGIVTSMLEALKKTEGCLVVMTDEHLVENLLLLIRKVIAKAGER